MDTSGVRIAEVFRQLRREGRGALLPYFTAGYPSLEASADFLVCADALGVAGAEVGFPYSDSIADGPTICSSFQAALMQGLRVGDIFEMVSSVRQRISMLLLGMVSYSIVERVGVETFVDRASASGFDGLIIPDLSLEEAGRVRELLGASGLSLVMLVAPTTSAARRELICGLSGGLVYYVSVAGITGERGALPADLEANVAGLRRQTDLPVCVGFGLSGPEQVAAVCRFADGAILGSALVRRIAAGVDAGHARGQIVESVGVFLESLQRAAQSAQC